MITLIILVTAGLQLAPEYRALFRDMWSEVEASMRGNARGTWTGKFNDRMIVATWAGDDAGLAQQMTALPSKF